MRVAFVRLFRFVFRFVCVLCVWNSWLRMRLHRVVTTGATRALVERLTNAVRCVSYVFVFD